MKDIDTGNSAQCPVCNSNVLRSRDSRGLTLIVCRRCGKFLLGDLGEAILQKSTFESGERLYKLSHYLRTVSERAIGKRDNSFFPIYTADDFERILESPDPPVVDKLRMLLQYLGDITEYPGQVNEFDASNDYPVVCAKNYQESNFYLDALVEQGLCSSVAPFTGKLTLRYKITAAGWTELDRVAKSGDASSEAFIAMWFDKSRQPLEKAISQAVGDAGYKPVRIDKVEHINRIDDEIIARIRRSKFLIADFTGHRNGVYFEAGFMLGLGRPVIWLCEKADLKNLHFDTRQYNTIDYVDTADLQKRLQVRIEAIMGKGPLEPAKKD